jgi:hypothetical protein
MTANTFYETCVPVDEPRVRARRSLSRLLGWTTPGRAGTENALTTTCIEDFDRVTLPASAALRPSLP